MNKFLKNISLLVLLMIMCFGCTEIYQPDIHTDNQMLVVEGLITNDSGPYTVKLSYAEPLQFDSTVTTYAVQGAIVYVKDNYNNMYSYTESTAGTYSSPSYFRAKVGNFYTLHIIIPNGDTYESKPEELLAPQNYDSIRAFTDSKDYINKDNELESVEGADVRVDLFNSYPKTDSVPACRFDPILTLQYIYTYRDLDINGRPIMDHYWYNFGWNTYNLNTTTNITDEKAPSQSPLIKNHALCFVPFVPWSYGLVLPREVTDATPTPVVLLYYLRVYQYTLNHDSYHFYQDANNQLSATGEIFDPINSQLYGNMRCVTDTSKTVLGLFEVSSVQKNAYLLNVLTYDKDLEILKTNFMIVSPDVYIKHIRVGLGGIVLRNPLPSWWYHN